MWAEPNKSRSVYIMAVHGRYALGLRGNPLRPPLKVQVGAGKKSIFRNSTNKRNRMIGGWGGLFRGGRKRYALKSSSRIRVRSGYPRLRKRVHRGSAYYQPVLFRGRRSGSTAPELKFHDVDLDDAVIASGGSITDSINKIAQGTTESERIGRKCNIASINWRFNIDLPETTVSSSTGDVARVIMYIDKQANGATAAITDILETANYQSFNNLSNKGRFRTLMDRTYALNAESGGGDGTTEDYGRVNISDTFFKKCNIPIEFSAATGAITEIRSNNIGVLLISLSGKVGFDSKIRLRFSDL